MLKQSALSALKASVMRVVIDVLYVKKIVLWI